LDSERYRLVLNNEVHFERCTGEDAMGHPVWGKAQEMYSREFVKQLIMSLTKTAPLTDRRRIVSEERALKLRKASMASNVPVTCEDGKMRPGRLAGVFHRGAQHPLDPNPYGERGPFSRAWREGAAHGISTGRA
jgi:hypothetical protein